MTPTVDNWRQFHTRQRSATVERANALRPVKLMGRKRHNINVERSHIDWNMADCMCGVRVEHNVALMGDTTNLLHVSNRANLIVRHHDRDQNGTWCDGTLDILGIHTRSEERR